MVTHVRLLRPIELSYPMDVVQVLPHRPMELLVRGPQLAAEVLGKRQVVGIVDGALTESTCHLQRLTVEIPWLM